MKDKRNKKIESIMVTVMILLLIIGVTYAYFMISKTITFGEVSSGTLNMEFAERTDKLELLNTPIYEENIDTEANYITFTIENTGTLDMYTEIYFKDIDISDGLINYDFKWRLEDITENDDVKIINEGTFINVKDSKEIMASNQLIKPGIENKKEYRVRIYVLETERNQGILNDTHFKGKVAATGYSREQKMAVPNSPKLAEGMLPVVYDEATDTWKKAGGDRIWYDYEEFMWANAVTVTEENRETYLNSEPGTPIPMEDINTMWVWIPRYKYRIPSNIGSTTNVTEPPEIDVIFETGLQATGVSESKYRNAITEEGTVPEGTYYTHPAFRNGEEVNNGTPYDIGGWGEELTGIWVAKFETGGTTENPVIKPNISPITGITIQKQFTSALKFAEGIISEPDGKIIFNGNNSYGLTNRVDTHMIKSIEWGMVAYLSQSRYGKMGNSNFDNNNKEIYRNNTTGTFTGRSEGKIGNSFTSYGTYSYNGYTCVDAKCITGTRDSETILKGTGASTTGTIYGIYDLNGGNYEYSLGYKGSDKSLEFTTTPERKYYDLYKSVITKDTSIMGDATWETNMWYNDHFNHGGNWLVRSGNAGLTYEEGAFLHFWENGTNTSNLYSFRTFLIP